MDKNDLNSRRSKIMNKQDTLKILQEAVNLSNEMIETNERISNQIENTKKELETLQGLVGDIAVFTYVEGKPVYVKLSQLLRELSYKLKG